MVIQVIKIFLYSSVYSWHLLLISSFKSLPFLSFTMPLLAWNTPLISPIFLKRSLVFLILLFSLFLLVVHLKRPSYRVWVFLYFSSSFLRIVNVYCTSILMICENWESNKVLNATLAPSFQRNQVLILAFEVYKIVHKFSLYHCWKRYDSCYSYTQFLFQDLPVWTPLTSRHFTNLCHLIFISDNYYLQFTLSKMSLKENKSWPKFTIT